MSDIYMKGNKTRYSTRKTKQFASGRVCIDKDCEQVLSIYNDNKQCFKHAPKKQPRIRGWIDPDKKKS